MLTSPKSNFASNMAIGGLAKKNFSRLYYLTLRQLPVDNVIRCDPRCDCNACLSVIIRNFCFRECHYFLKSSAKLEVAR